MRFSTAGSVDDGKGTLIGRLLYDSKGIFEDQAFAAIEQTSKQRGNATVDLALLTDGLRAERERGITIDVAYRYFATPRRKFIIADTPGHIQYTRNMVTGASTADTAVVLIDARVAHSSSRAVTPSSPPCWACRIVVAINKMDLVDWSEEVFERITSEFAKALSAKLDVHDITFIPISALYGDNVVEHSTNMRWYGGPGAALSPRARAHRVGPEPHRQPIPGSIRDPAQTDEHHDYRGYAGQVATGTFRARRGCRAVGASTRVARVETFDGEVEEAIPPMSISMLLEDDIDISRGDMICRPHPAPDHAGAEAMVCWMSDRPLDAGSRYVIKHTTRSGKALVDEVRYRIDVNTCIATRRRLPQPERDRPGPPPVEHAADG